MRLSGRGARGRAEPRYGTLDRRAVGAVRSVAHAERTAPLRLEAQQSDQIGNGRVFGIGELHEEVVPRGLTGVDGLDASECIESPSRESVLVHGLIPPVTGAAARAAARLSLQRPR